MHRISKYLCSALLVLAMLVVTAPAQAFDRISPSAANSIWRSSNYAGACGAGAVFYCSRLGTSWCDEPYGAFSRLCKGYYVRGPGWPVTSKINCYAEGFVNYSNRDYWTNICWA